MMMRILNICVIVALVVAAAYVYRIKFESIRRAEEVAKLRLDIRNEHNAIAALRAEWSRLDNPVRIQQLAQRHLALRSIDIHQFDSLDHLPDRPPDLVPPEFARSDRHPAGRARDCDQQHPVVGKIPMTAVADQPDAVEPALAPAPQPTEPAPPAKPAWRGTLVRRLLYGRNVDRAAKAKARLGLAILAFAIGYTVIAGRLVMFAAAPEARLGRHGSTQDAIATARPDILDRNGEILATDVRAPSLFAEPNRIIDVDEATELLSAVLPDLDAPELRERLGARRRFMWLKRDITANQRAEIYRLGLPGIGFLPENKRVYPNGAEVSHVIGHVNIDNQGIAGIEKWLDGNGLADLHLAGLATDRLQEPVRLSLDLRVQHGAARRAAQGQGEVQGQGRGRGDRGGAHRRDCLDGVGAGL